MRKPKIGMKQIERGTWAYKSVKLGAVSVKAGDTTFKMDESAMITNEGVYDCVKIGKTIYDVEDYVDGVVKLTEEIKEDFEGIALYEASFPIIIRTKSTITSMMINEEMNFDKVKFVEKTLDMMSPKKQLYWMNKLKEVGKVNLVANQVAIITIKEDENEKQDAYQNEIRKYLELVINFDMDYEYEDKSTLWDILGLPKGNYVAVTKRLMEFGILGNDEDYFTLKFTIDAIKNKEENIEKYISEKVAEANYYLALEEVRKKMSEEEFKNFIENLMKNQGQGVQNGELQS